MKKHKVFERRFHEWKFIKCPKMIINEQELNSEDFDGGTLHGRTDITEQQFDKIIAKCRKKSFISKFVDSIFN